MKSPLQNTSIAVLLGLGTLCAQEGVPARNAAAEQPEQAVGNPGLELLLVTHDMWFLLSGVADKEDADAAAPRFEELAMQAASIGERFFAGSVDGQDVEVIGTVPYQRISDSYEDLYQEFDVLCQTQCYGSEALMDAFRLAVDLGIFCDDSLVLLDTQHQPLSDAELTLELTRFKRLEEPDRAVLQILQGVKDAGSAEEAVAGLMSLAERLQQLAPEEPRLYRNYGDRDRASLQAGYKPIEPLLWGIRNEVVRIASLPGYDGESFDAFSDALDNVFEKLGDAHGVWFYEVFDASFHTDWDDALREGAQAPAPARN